MFVGVTVGCAVGTGYDVGDWVGENEGVKVGKIVGTNVGAEVGAHETYGQGSLFVDPLWNAQGFPPFWANWITLYLYCL